MMTMRDQLKNIRTGTTVRLSGPGTGAYGRFRLIQHNRNGCAVFQPVTLREDFFVDLSSADFTVER